MGEPGSGRRRREGNRGIGRSRLQRLEQAVRHHHVPDPGGANDEDP